MRGGALNRSPDEGLPPFAHFDTADNCAFQWKIENGKWKIVTQLYPVSLRAGFDSSLSYGGADLRTDDARSASPDSEQIEHTVAKPQMRIFASVEQIQDRLGRGLTQFSCNADKNHVTQLRRVDFSLPNLSSNNPSSSTRFCEHSADKKQAGFPWLRLEKDSEYSFSPWWALPSKEEIRGLSALDGERVASRGWRVLQETKSRSKTWNCRLMRATKQVSRRDEGEIQPVTKLSSLIAQSLSNLSEGEDAVVLALASYKCGEGVYPVRGSRRAHLC